MASCVSVKGKGCRTTPALVIVQELCESRGGRPELSVLTSLLVFVDVKNYCTVLRHWSQLVPNMLLTSEDIKHHFIINSSLGACVSVKGKGCSTTPAMVCVIVKGKGCSTTPAMMRAHRGKTKSGMIRRRA